MDSSVTVRFGAETSGLESGADRADQTVSGLDARLGKLDKTLVRLDSSIKKAFGQKVDNGQVAETDRLVAAIDRLEKRLSNVIVRDGQRRRSQQQNIQQNKAEGTSLDELGRKAENAGKKVQNATKPKGGGGGDVGFMGLRPFELQTLSYQVNDFFTQIASGSSVMQASAQQGGQVFQIFQGQIGKLIPILPQVALGIGAVVLAIGGLMRLQSDTAMLREFEAQLMLSADGSLYQAQALSESARALDLYGGSLEEAKKSLGALIKEGVDSSELEDFGKSAEDLATVMKIDVVDAAKEVGKAFTGNYDNIAELDDAINFLTASEREHIRALFDSGDAQAARSEAFGIFRNQIGEAADYMRGPAADASRALEGAWDGLMGRIANSSVIVNTMNELRTLVGWVERAMQLTGQAIPEGKSGASRGAPRSDQGGLYRNDYGFGYQVQGMGYIGYERPQWVDSLLGIKQPEQAAPAAPQRPTGPSQQQLKAEQDLTREYTRQATASSQLTSEMRLSNAAREAQARAAGLNLTNEQTARVVAAARAAEQSKIDREEESKAGARARSAAAASRRAQNEAEREARETRRTAEVKLRAEMEAIDTLQALAQDDYQEQLRLQDQKIEAIKKFYGDESREAQNAVQQRIRLERQLQDQQDRLADQRRDSQQRIAEAGADAEAAIRQEGLEDEADLIQRQLSARQITQEAAIAALADIKRREIDLERETAERIFQIRMASLREQLSAQSLTVVERDAINRRIEELEAQHQASMAALTRQGGQVATQATRDTTETIRTQWESRVQPIGGALANLFTGAATGTQTLMMGVQGVGQAILGEINSWIAKQITSYLTAEAIKTSAAVTGETARTAATTAGVTTRTAVEATGAAATIASSGAITLADIGNSALRAAAGAYAAIAGIPIIGPVLAPVTAAAALAGVLALGSRIFSAEGGWGEVPEDGAKTVLHKKEMVLPAKFAVPLRSMLTSSRPTGALGTGVAGGFSGGSAADLVKDRAAMMSALERLEARGPMSVQISTIDKRGMKRFLEENSGPLQNALERRARDLKFSGG